MCIFEKHLKLSKCYVCILMDWRSLSKSLSELPKSDIWNASKSITHFPLIKMYILFSSCNNLRNIDMHLLHDLLAQRVGSSVSRVEFIIYCTSDILLSVISSVRIGYIDRNCMRGLREVAVTENLASRCTTLCHIAPVTNETKSNIAFASSRL